MLSLLFNEIFCKTDHLAMTNFAQISFSMLHEFGYILSRLKTFDEIQLFFVKSVRFT